MICPRCKSDKIQVIDSRDVDARTIRRRRECEDCNFRFTSYERVEQAKVQVEKRNGAVEPFDREKIIKGLRVAGRDRILDEQIFDIADEIEQKVIESAEPQIASRKIGNMVINRLKKLDKVAYLRFASVYKNFEDLDSFEQELIKLKK
jgi:transcriptional repressor NrdR